MDMMLTQEAILEKLDGLYKAENEWQTKLKRFYKVDYGWRWCMSCWSQPSPLDKDIDRAKVALRHIREQIHDLEVVFDALEPQPYTVVELA